jgi:hypothetical protein
MWLVFISYINELIKLSTSPACVLSLGPSFGWVEVAKGKHCRQLLALVLLLRKDNMIFVHVLDYQEVLIDRNLVSLVKILHFCLGA